MGFPGLPSDHVWYSLGRWGWANVDWCEETVMGWVTEPANTWSNFAYVLVGLIFLVRKEKSSHPFYTLMPLAAIGLGLLSGFYHATNAWVTQWGDFMGMYLVASLPLLINLKRMGHKRAGTVQGYGLLLLLSGLITALAHYAGLPVQLPFAFFFLAIVLTELSLRKSSPVPLRHFALSLGMFAVAATCSFLDITRTVCDPHNHYLQGHALWHCFSALGIYFAYKHCQKALTLQPSSP